MNDIAGWIAPVATMLAAMMTAANLGTRVTGWGFGVFTIGSIAWVTVALATGQINLLVSNALLTLVNLVGIWRWLGLRARHDDAAEAERERSDREEGPGLFAATKLEGMKVVGPDGAPLARVADAMTRCRSGQIDHLIIRVGGVAGVMESLRRLDWDDVKVAGDAIEVSLGAEAVARLPLADKG